jgi:uncharacterized protein with von Willebrand factor type A (vWA) domain
MEETPLYRLFNALRRANMVLGLDDYLVALEALQLGYGLNGRDDLCELCQIIWVNSEADRHLFLSIFNELYPPQEKKLDTADKEETKQDVVVGKREGDSGLMRTPPKAGSEAPKSSIESGTEKQQAGEMAVTEKQLEEAAKLAQSDEIQSFWQRPQPEIALPEEPRSDLGVEFLPVTARQMKQSFRHLRQAVREGPRDELDVEKTVENIARKGILLEPVMRARRVNRASLYLLLDQGGSMGPFHPLSRRLVETAEKGSRLRKMEAYYFHNYPADYLYCDPQLMSETAVEQVFNEVNQYRPGMIIFSDAGAARGMYNQRRVNWTYYFITRLRRAARQIAWLNPVPEDRWKNTTAATIASFVPMFAVDRQGLQRAVDVLRGQVG